MSSSMSSSSEHRLDLGRRQRLGMVEAIWGENKSAEQIARLRTTHMSQLLTGAALPA